MIKAFAKQIVATYARKSAQAERAERRASDLIADFGAHAAPLADHRSRSASHSQQERAFYALVLDAL